MTESPRPKAQGMSLKFNTSMCFSKYSVPFRLSVESARPGCLLIVPLVCFNDRLEEALPPRSIDQRNMLIYVWLKPSSSHTVDDWNYVLFGGFQLVLYMYYTPHLVQGLQKLGGPFNGSRKTSTTLIFRNTARYTFMFNRNKGGPFRSELLKYFIS